MQLLLAPQVIKRLKRELRRAGRQEIGGLLMGEHVRDEVFRVIEISVQGSGGSHSCFIRNPSNHKAQLEKFFAETCNDYARFNYLGEWHSHPNFDPVPSFTDIETMQSIVDDPDVGANFLVLLIPKLGSRKQIEATATAFRARTLPLAVPLLAESESNAQREGGVSRWLRSIFGPWER
jgi:integrative and conjugative element protein (TIGR02256 family)